MPNPRWIAGSAPPVGSSPSVKPLEHRLTGKPLVPKTLTGPLRTEVSIDDPMVVEKFIRENQPAEPHSRVHVLLKALPVQHLKMDDSFPSYRLSRAATLNYLKEVFPGVTRFNIHHKNDHWKFTVPRLLTETERWELEDRQDQ